MRKQNNNKTYLLTLILAFARMLSKSIIFFLLVTITVILPQSDKLTLGLQNKVDAKTS